MITVVLHRGQIEEITGIPFGVTVEVRDYDCDMVNEQDLTLDDEEQPFIHSIYTSESNG